MELIDPEPEKSAALGCRNWGQGYVYCRAASTGWVQFRFGPTKGAFGIDGQGNIIQKRHISVPGCHA